MDGSSGANAMSTFALGQIEVRRSGYGAMQLAGQFAFGVPPDRAFVPFCPLEQSLFEGHAHRRRVAHPRENLAAEHVTLDDDALGGLDGIDRRLPNAR
jgi:hypothetical protein